jgi:DNA-binding MarR family transcriptional regulator
VKNAPDVPLRLEDQPGFHIRRLQQIAVALFLEETAEFQITPVQFAALFTVREHPGIDQRTLAETIGFDVSTIGGVIDRLERRGLLTRSASLEDRRAKVLRATADGNRLLEQIAPGMLRAQQRILDPLPVRQRSSFLRMLQTVVDANNGLSRAPAAARALEDYAAARRR